MQHSRPTRIPSGAHHRTQGEEVHRDTEEHRDHDEREATAAWLDHIAAGRIQVR